MVSDETKAVIRKSKEIYAQQLRAELESSARGKFVAIDTDRA